MALLGFLIAFPLLVAIALMAFRKDSVRDPLVIGSAAVIGVASVACAVTFMGSPSTFAMTPEMSLAGNYVAVAVDLFLCGLVFALSIAYRNGVMFAMSFVQLLVSIWCGSFALHPEDAMAEPMYIDNLSVIMVLIVGLVGSAICIYALGYMKDFQPLNETELEAVKKVQSIFCGMNLIPCTACRYCTDGCPRQIAIPDLFAVMNTKQIYHDWNADFYYNNVYTGAGRRASDCIQCGRCEKACPQHLPIRRLLTEIAAEFDKQ